MGRLTDKEKQELLDFAHSSKLREDFRQMEERRNQYIKHSFTADDYIEFLNFTNAVINHKRKSFRKIKGDNFKI